MKQWKLSRDEWMAVYDNFKTKVSMWLSVSCDITLLWNGELKGLSIYEKEENREHRKSLETHEKCYKSLERVKKAWNSFEWEHRKSLETHEECYKSLERVKKAWNSFEKEHWKSLETHEECYKSLERVKKACTASKKNTEKCFIITWKGEKAWKRFEKEHWRFFYNHLKRWKAWNSFEVLVIWLWVFTGKWHTAGPAV